MAWKRVSWLGNAGQSHEAECRSGAVMVAIHLPAARLIGVT